MAEVTEATTPEVPANSPAETAAPSQPAATDVVTPPAGGTEPAVAEQLYELPDGRKVDASSLTREWKDNFLPEFTRKSQDLAALQASKTPQPSQNNQPSQQPWQDPSWVPQSYAEIIAAAKAEIQGDFAKQAQAQQQRLDAIQTTVDSQLGEIKKLEPNLSEELLFQHAMKYGFQPDNLTAAFNNMRDFNIAVKRTEQQVQKNMQNRANEPVATKVTPPSSSNAIDYNQLGKLNNMSPSDWLRSVKGQ